MLRFWVLFIFIGSVDHTLDINHFINNILWHVQLNTVNYTVTKMPSQNIATVFTEVKFQLFYFKHIYILLLH